VVAWVCVHIAVVVCTACDAHPLRGWWRVAGNMGATSWMGVLATVGLLSLALGHPRNLECGTENTTRLRVHQKVMGGVNKGPNNDNGIHFQVSCKSAQLSVTPRVSLATLGPVNMLSGTRGTCDQCMARSLDHRPGPCRIFRWCDYDARTGPVVCSLGSVSLTSPTTSPISPSTANPTTSPTTTFLELTRHRAALSGQVQ
jgi:hypothetical protein